MTAWFSKAFAPLIVLGLMIVAALLLGWLALSTVDGIADKARASAVAERDAHWTGEIAKFEAATQTRIAEQLKETMAAEAAARSEVAAYAAQLAEMEAENAALPDGGACGLGRDRVRLLNKP